MRDPVTQRPKTQAMLGTAIIFTSIAASFGSVNGLEYTIVEGDVLSTIAATYDITVDELAAANEIEDPDLIVSGRTLTVPEDAPRVDKPTVLTHSVSGGENLWTLARTYSVPLGALARLNGIGGDAIIVPGQLLQLPDTTPPAIPKTPANVTTESTYVVKAGDNAWAIADATGAPLQDLLAGNGLSDSSVLNIGQELILPVPLPPNAQGLPTDLVASAEKLALIPVFERWANEYDVPPELVKAVAWFESGWSNDKRSSANAIGIGQLLEITAQFVSEEMIGESLDPTVPEDNIRLSARYLRYLLDNTDSVELAVAAYYQGLTATRQHGVYQLSVFYVEGVLALQKQFV